MCRVRVLRCARRRSLCVRRAEWEPRLKPARAARPRPQVFEGVSVDENGKQHYLDATVCVRARAPRRGDPLHALCVDVTPAQAACSATRGAGPTPLLRPLLFCVGVRLH